MNASGARKPGLVHYSREDRMQSIITLTEAKAKFSELINRIIFKKETFVVTKKGRKVAVVIPMEKYRPEDSDGLIDARGFWRN